MSVLLVDLPAFSKNKNLEKVKKARWRVSHDALASFLDTHDVNLDAADWAGEGFIVSHVETNPIGSLGHYVTVEARHVGVRMVEIRRNAKFNGYDPYGNILAEVVYTGRWQVHADYCAEFDRKIGLSAADWAESGFTVTSLNASRVSDMEYEYTVEAKDLDASGTGNIPFTYDPRHDLGSRKDYKFSSANIFFSARDAGWMKNSKGELVEMNKQKSGSWTPSVDCPFRTESVLPKAMADCNLSCVAVTETIYRKGLPERYASSLRDWQKNNPVVTSIGGTSGNWKKKSQSTSIITDNRNNPWTKITRHYLDAPGYYQWNVNYRDF